MKTEIKNDRLEILRNKRKGVRLRIEMLDSRRNVPLLCSACGLSFYKNSLCNDHFQLCTYLRARRILSGSFYLHPDV